MPVNSLPTDLLCPILLLVVETPDARHSLKLVCKLWNGIVEGTGQFWSRFIYLGNLTKSSDLKFWKRQVARARTAPLEVVWRISAYTPNVNKSLLKAQIEEIPFVRWRKLDIVGPQILSSIELEAFASKSDFKNLIELSTGPAHSVPYTILRHVAKTALRLKVLKMEDFWGDHGSSADIRTILSRISTLRCEYIPSHPTRCLVTYLASASWHLEADRMIFAMSGASVCVSSP